VRVSAIATSILLAFGVWSAGAATPDLQFTDAPSAMPKGDAMRGADAYEGSCGGCHSLDASRIGPAHRGVVGRPAGSVADFNYSPALKASRVVWTPETLDRWLINPQDLIKGARMGFRLSDAQKRADVIAYLAREGGGQ
jgi:cytochrome c